jgi:hypothetical protein
MVDELSLFLARRPSPRDGEDVDVAVRAKAAQGRRAVQVCADEIRPEKGSDAVDDPLDLLLWCHGGLAMVGIGSVVRI